MTRVDILLAIATVTSVMIALIFIISYVMEGVRGVWSTCKHLAGIIAEEMKLLAIFLAMVLAVAWLWSLL